MKDIAIGGDSAGGWAGDIDGAQPARRRGIGMPGAVPLSAALGGLDQRGRYSVNAKSIR